MKLAVKNWSTFQHYKSRRPPWIKLHRTLLDDQDWHSLPDASKALAVSLWLLASESNDGSVDCDSEALAFRLRADSKSIEKALQPLIDKGFLLNASKTLAKRKQVAPKSCSETETETETETEVGSSDDKPVRFSAKKFLTDRGVESKLADEYLTVRKSKKLANVETAFELIEKEAIKANLPFPDAIRRCVENSWGGFKASWQPTGQATPDSWVQTI